MRDRFSYISVNKKFLYKNIHIRQFQKLCFNLNNNDVILCL